MVKISLIVLSLLMSVHAAQAQLPPVPEQNEELEQLGDLSEDDPEQEQEIQIATDGNPLIKKTAISNSTAEPKKIPSLNSLYEAKTLMIAVPRREIQKNNKWQKMNVAFDNSMGVSAFSNKKGGKWQCTELVHRFLKTVYGVPTKIGNGMGHANVLIQNLAEKFGESTFKFKNLDVQMVLRKDGISVEPPAAGSVINFAIGKFGHTAVVRYVEVVDTNTVKAYLFEQHGFPSVKVGDNKPIRVITFNRSDEGRWTGERLLGAGQSLYWINFKVL